MKVKLDDERKNSIKEALIGFFSSEFDEELSDYKASEVVNFMLQQIGPSQYNQAIQDARKFMSEKLDDLDTEFYEPEER